VRAPAEAVGRCISGKYRLGEVLATGGMGVVHAGVHLVTGRAVAIKRLRPELVSEPDIVRRVSREAALSVDASHPNVVEVLDAGADEAGVPYLVLERLFGQTLESLLEAPLPLLATAQALIPVCNAVAALHRIGILHRDIKPSNIFLHRTPEGHVTPKLLDFGIAKALARSGTTTTRLTLGTPAYMAPEQSLGYHGGGAAADVWSMGVVFVRCLTGRLPFEHGAAERVTLRSALRSEVAAVLARALAFEPAERIADMAAFRAALLEALAAVDGGAAWPGVATIGYAPAEFVLSSAIAFDAAPAILATRQGARPQGVATRTLAEGAARAGRAWARARQPALLAAAAVAATAVALVMANGGARHASETSAAALHAASSAAPHETAAVPDAVDATSTAPSVMPAADHEPPADRGRVPPSAAATSLAASESLASESAASSPAAYSPATASASTSPRDVAIVAEPTSAPPRAASHTERPRVGSRAPVPASLERAPVVALSPASPRSSSPSAHSAVEFRVGANRAPIIE